MAENVTSTIIGESILINGNLSGDEDLTVLGRVEGQINLTKTLNIEESGIVKANISVRNAIISGVMVGNIVASDSVEITEVGRMVGDIKAPRVIIVDGARYRGTIDMGDLEAPRASGGAITSKSDSKALARTTTPTRAALPAPAAKRPVATAPAAPIKKADAPTKPVVTGNSPSAAPVLAGAKKIKKKVVVKKKV
jgi:cytoskeletal protein CcmA (bactofilin family)